MPGLEHVYVEYGGIADLFVAPLRRVDGDGVIEGIRLPDESHQLGPEGAPVIAREHPLTG